MSASSLSPRSLRLSVGVCLLALVAFPACSGTAGSSGHTPVCEGAELLLAKGLRPAQEVDFVGFRVESTEPRVVTGGGAPAESGPQPRPADPPSTAPPSGSATVAAWSATFTNDVRGVPCSGAKDKAACEQKIAGIRVLGTACDGFSIVPKVRAPGADAAPSRQPGQCAAAYLVYTRGDEVGYVTSDDVVREFLGEVDSPQEAIYLAQRGGERFVCSGAAPAAFTKVEDGYEVVASSGPCASRIVQVTKAGVIKLVRLDNDQC